MPIAVAAHQPGTLLTVGAQEVEVRAAHLVVLAIAEHLHGAQAPDGSRLSDRLIQDLVADALEAHGTDTAFAIVAMENQRSLSLCERNGLTSQTAYNEMYARVTGRFSRS